MRKVIAAINMTLDGDCDHSSGIADDEIHQHYKELLHNSALRQQTGKDILVGSRPRQDHA